MPERDEGGVTLPEILKRFGFAFRGSYAESAEGVLTPYEESGDPPRPLSEEEVHGVLNAWAETMEELAQTKERLAVAEYELAKERADA